MEIILILIVVAVVAFFAYKNFSPKAEVKVEAKPVVAEVKVAPVKAEAPVKTKAPAKAKTAAKKTTAKKPKSK